TNGCPVCPEGTAGVPLPSALPLFMIPCLGGGLNAPPRPTMVPRPTHALARSIACEVDRSLRTQLKNPAKLRNAGADSCSAAISGRAFPAIQARLAWY